MKPFQLYLVSICIATVIGFNSCKKDDFNFKKISTNMDWNPSYAIPIGYGTLDMRDILRDYDHEHLFQSDQSGLLKMIYTANIGQYHADDKFYVPAQTYTETMTNGEMNMSAFTYAGAVVTYSKTQHNTISVVPSGSEIDSVKIKSAILNFEVSSTFLHAGTMTLKFPTITKNGIAYSKTINFDNSGHFIYATSYNDLDGYKMDLTTSSGGFNNVDIEFSLSMTHSGAGSTLGTIGITIGLDYIRSTAMFGYFGNQQIVFAKDSIDMKMFSDAFTGGYYFEDPKFNVSIENSFGVPLRFYFTHLKSYSTINNDSLQVTGIGVPYFLNPKSVNAPLIGYHYGETLSDNVSLNKNNSNIAQSIGIAPHYFIFGALAETNPGTAHTHNNYVTENSTVTANMEVELPLWGWAKGLALQDTEKFEFSKYYTDYHGNILQKAIIRIASENHMPVEVGIQLYFAHFDTLTHIYFIKDSLMGSDRVIVPAGITNTEGKVISSGTKVKDVVIEQAKLKKLKDDKITHMFYRAFLNTSNALGGQSVRFYNDDKLHVHTGIQCDFGTNTFTIQKY